MGQSNLPLAERAETYCRSFGLLLHRPLGKGKDGTVWLTDRPSAVKVHERTESYQHERDAYIRLLNVGVDSAGEFQIPTLIDFDDALLVIEMSIVSPPFVVDFASCRLDHASGLIEDEGNTLDDMVRERFGEQADDVLQLRDRLIGLAGIYLWDLHPENIKF
jgi:hypothetical protein